MKKTYIIIILLSVVMGIYLLGFGIHAMSQNILMWVAFIPFFLFSWGVVGLSVNYEAEKNPISFGKWYFLS